MLLEFLQMKSDFLGDFLFEFGEDDRAGGRTEREIESEKKEGGRITMKHDEHR